MGPLLTLLVKAIVAGVLVVLFALIGEAVRPKRFAGLFGAAPAIALASLLITALTRGASAAVPFTLGMLAGSAGMVAYCVVCLVTLDRLHALAGSVTAWVAWVLVAGGIYFAVLR